MRRRRRNPVGKHGRVIGTLRHGVSVSSTYEGTLRIRVGALETWRNDDHVFTMTARQARELGFRLVEEAAKAKLERERYVQRQRFAAARDRQRAREAAAQATTTATA